jgi:hypothetical protein
MSRPLITPLNYIARYIHRVTLSNHQIPDRKDGNITLLERVLFVKTES